MNMKWRNLGVLLSFTGIIAAGTIAGILKKDVSFSENENRFLQQKPVLSVETFFNGKFESEYEAYVSDQFVFRNDWIALKTNTERLLQKKDINGVYFAKDHYLIERHEAEKMDTEQEQTNIERLETFVNTAAEKLGEDRVHVMLVPTASEILTSKLPAFAVGFNQQAVIDQVAREIPKGCLVDVSNVLKQHADEYIYYKTDHHWTTLGAYYAYAEWAKASGFTPFAPSDFDIKLVTDSFFGTIASKVNVSVQPDDIYLYEKKGNPKYEVEYNMETTSDGLYEYDRLETKDKYTVFLNGNNALVKIKSENKNGRKLLVIKDSFSHCFVPFLVDHFEEVYMIDFRYFRMGVNEFMEQEGITDALVLYNVINFVEDVNSLTFVR